MFKYDIHVHTSETSGCGKVSAAETVKRYIAAGYDGICITDHYSPRFFNKQSGTWRERADAFLRGYRAAKEIGGLDVILGAEFRFSEERYGHNDYLLYGITEEIIYACPELCRLSFPELRRLCDRYGLLIIQAHPLREENRIEELPLLDGLEVYNAHPGHDSRNEEVQAFAEGKKLIRTSSSDSHEIHHIGRSGILTASRIKDAAELVRVLKSGSYQLIL